MPLVYVLILAVVQGLAELLPVSSSAHVVVAERLLGLDPSSPSMTLLLVMLHTGTMFAVVIYFWRKWRDTYFQSIATFKKSVGFVVLASALTGLIGEVIIKVIETTFLRRVPHAQIEDLFGHLELVALALALVGILILVAGIADNRRSIGSLTEANDLNATRAGIVGAVQGLCLPFRGFSRSGATIYDYLVLGLGSTTNFYGLPGLEDRALTMKSLSDAMRLRNHLIAHLEEADSECCQVKNPLLTFVVAGGGFAGVETIVGINDFVRGALRSYPNLREDMIRVVLVHPGKFILPELGEKLGTYTQKQLEKKKVEIRVNTKVAAVTDRSVTLSDGTEIYTNTLVWTAGTSPNPLLANLPCLKERGRLVVNEFLEVCDWPNVWALGDCAAIPNTKGGPFIRPQRNTLCVRVKCWQETYSPQ